MSLWDRRWAVVASFALTGSPTGILGFIFEVAPIRHLVFSAGAGAGGVGPQLAGSVRLRFILSDSSAFAIGGGVSGGAFKELCVDCGPDWGVDPAYWANLDISWEQRWPSGLALRESFGLSNMLNPGGFHCSGKGSDTCIKSPSLYVLPYVGISMGYAF